MSPETRKQLMWAEHDRLWSPPVVFNHRGTETQRREGFNAESRRVEGAEGAERRREQHQC